MTPHSLVLTVMHRDGIRLGSDDCGDQGWKILIGTTSPKLLVMARKAYTIHRRIWIKLVGHR